MQATSPYPHPSPNPSPSPNQTLTPASALALAPPLSLSKATARVSYEDCGRTFRFINYVADQGRSLNTGMASTVSERYQNWVDEDGSAAGYATPLLIGSATAEAAGWWRLDDEVMVMFRVRVS